MRAAETDGRKPVMPDLEAMTPGEYDAYCAECDARGSAEYRMRRELCGIEIAEIADALGVRLDTAKRWENPRKGMPPSARAWAYVDERYERIMRAIEEAVSAVEDIEDMTGYAPKKVEVAYRRGSMPTRDGESVQDANRVAMLSVAVLRVLGYEVGVEWADSGAAGIAASAR